ncbi:F9U18 [Hyposoter didymator ichnovirus]|nr:F9U13 [Hyposoter didymator ichnovirus]AIK25755.1 F9U18 [Hyposoter didymator ichnovirus]
MLVATLSGPDQPDNSITVARIERYTSVPLQYDMTLVALSQEKPVILALKSHIMLQNRSYVWLTAIIQLTVFPSKHNLHKLIEDVCVLTRQYGLKEATFLLSTMRPRKDLQTWYSCGSDKCIQGSTGTQFHISISWTFAVPITARRVYKPSVQTHEY